MNTGSESTFIYKVIIKTNMLRSENEQKKKEVTRLQGLYMQQNNKPNKK